MELKKPTTKYGTIPPSPDLLSTYAFPPMICCSAMAQAVLRVYKLAEQPTAAARIDIKKNVNTSIHNRRSFQTQCYLVVVGRSALFGQPALYRTGNFAASVSLISRNSSPMARGAKPRSSKLSPPVTVHVLPLLVWPYANIAPLTPRKHAETVSSVVASKTSCALSFRV